MALAFLLAVFAFVILLIAAFIFPPTFWVRLMTGQKEPPAPTKPKADVGSDSDSTKPVA